MGIQLKTLSILALSSFTLSFGVITQAAMNHTFTAELQEVRTGSINGREYLTIQIDSSVGPANCQGSKLRVDTHSVTQPGKQEAMESIALQAMLTSERVVITVPLEGDDCVDGMPTLTDINLVTQAPFTNSISAPGSIPDTGFENRIR